MSEADRVAIEAQLPHLASSTYEITSCNDPGYNCFAWAAGDSEHVWSALEIGGGYFWPPGVPSLPSIGGIMAAYGYYGFSECESPSFEPGWEKIAIYVDEIREPRHAARQLPNGMWASKLGDSVDIEHAELTDVSGLLYGEATVFMRRWVGPGEPSSAPTPQVWPKSTEGGSAEGVAPASVERSDLK